MTASNKYTNKYWSVVNQARVQCLYRKNSSLSQKRLRLSTLLRWNRFSSSSFFFVSPSVSSIRKLFDCLIHSLQLDVGDGSACARGSVLKRIRLEFRDNLLHLIRSHKSKLLSVLCRWTEWREFFAVLSTSQIWTQNYSRNHCNWALKCLQPAPICLIYRLSVAQKLNKDQVVNFVVTFFYSVYEFIGSRLEFCLQFKIPVWESVCSFMQVCLMRKIAQRGKSSSRTLSFWEM